MIEEEVWRIGRIDRDWRLEIGRYREKAGTPVLDASALRQSRRNAQQAGKQIQQTLNRRTVPVDQFLKFTRQVFYSDFVLTIRYLRE